MDGSGGTRFPGRIHRSRWARGSFRASPSANPAGLRRRFDLAGIKRYGMWAGTTALLGLLLSAGSAAAQTGGWPAPGAPANTDPAASTVPAGTPRKATLIRKTGRAIPPPGAPPAVVAAIEAGNKIRKRPYVWGGRKAHFVTFGANSSG